MLLLFVIYMDKINQFLISRYGILWNAWRHPRSKASFVTNILIELVKSCSVAVELVIQPAVFWLIPGTGTVLVRLVDVVGDEATLRAGQRDEATLSVVATQIVILVGGCVWGRAQERGVLSVRPGLTQVRIMLPSDHVVHIWTRAVASLSWSPGSMLTNRNLSLLSSPKHSGWKWCHTCNQKKISITYYSIYIEINIIWIPNLFQQSKSHI